MPSRRLLQMGLTSNRDNPKGAKLNKPGAIKSAARRPRDSANSLWGMACLFVLHLVLVPVCLGAAPSNGELSVNAYPSIQTAIDANPGRMIYVPAGDYEISEPIHLRADNGGLFGPARIVQTRSNAAIIEIRSASGIRLRDLRLVRAQGQTETFAPGITAERCTNLVIEGVQVVENHSTSAAIRISACRVSAVRNCSVLNYACIAVDDRTSNTNCGYAFNCIDGTGIAVFASMGILIQGCRVIESRLAPSPETQKAFHLGNIIMRARVKGPLIDQETWDSGYTKNWYQGSAIIVSSPEASDCTQVLDNYIENAGQGIDIHSDHVTLSQNIVVNAHIGMKAMHGSRNVLITGNQFSRNDLWAIGLMPGVASHGPVKGKPESANEDGGSIVANNIISDFGHGRTHWLWGPEQAPLRFDSGQEAEDPPLSEVIIQGNLVYCVGAPRYKYAVLVAGGTNGPRGLHFANNLLPPGTAGVANKELSP
jgi:hypothetical protein